MDRLVESVVMDAMAVYGNTARPSDMDTSESLEPVGFLVEVGTVALERCALVTESDISLGYLHIGQHHLVVAKIVGMVDIESAAFLLHGFLRIYRL